MPSKHPETNTNPTHPTIGDVKDELERVLGSHAFQQAGRASQFLRFIVEETLAGRGDRLKGYTIAVAVFDRPADFDAQSDPVVRVEAGRLRRRIMEHYLAEGLESPVRIELPRGGYTPQFRYTAKVIRRLAETQPAKGTAATLQIGWKSGAAAALLLALLVGVAAVSWQSRTPRPVSAPANGARAPAFVDPATRLLVLPLVDLSGDQETANFAAGLTEETIRELVDWRIVSIASGTSDAIASASLETLRDEFAAGYVLTGNVRATEGGVRVAVRLLESSAGTQLWTHTFDKPLTGRTGLAVEEQIAADLAVMLASPYGPMYAHEIERVAQKPPAHLLPYECVLQFYGYVQTYDPRAHATSSACLERAVREQPNNAPAWASLATIYLHEQTFGFNPRQGDPPALERALEAARRSLDIDGGDRVAATVLAGIRLAEGDRVGFERATERVMSMPRRHPAVLMHFGFLLTMSGNWSAGIPLLDEAMPLISNPPGWIYAAYAFRDLQLGQYAGALHSALRIDAPNWFVAPMTVAAAAALADRADIAQRETTRLVELYPTFASEGAELLAKWGMSETLREVVLDGLGRAGLVVDRKAGGSRRNHDAGADAGGTVDLKVGARLPQSLVDAP